MAKIKVQLQNSDGKIFEMIESGDNFLHLANCLTDPYRDPAVKEMDKSRVDSQLRAEYSGTSAHVVGWTVD